MDKTILKQLYKPICIQEYDDDYFDELIDFLQNSCPEASFDYYLNCMKFFLCSDDEALDDLVNLLAEFQTEDPDLLRKKRAHLTVFAQAIVYERILNSSDDDLRIAISLSIRTLMFGRENIINHFQIGCLKDFHRKIIEEKIKEYKKSILSDKNEDALTFIIKENEVLKWQLNQNISESQESNNALFAFNLGKEFALKCGTHFTCIYPEAYIAKIIQSSKKGDSYIEEMRISEIIDSINLITEINGHDSVLFPILSMSVANDFKINLIDLAIEVYYEQMLLNYLTLIEDGE